jgi:hypothetical protein
LYAVTTREHDGDQVARDTVKAHEVTINNSSIHWSTTLQTGAVHGHHDRGSPPHR